MSTCFFSLNRPDGALRSPATDLSSVSCNVESIKPISDYLIDLPPSINLYGCSALELIFLRGNGEELCNVDCPETKSICKAHLDFLLLKWPNKNQFKQSMRSGQKITHCALPHDVPRSATNSARIRKEEVLEWLTKTGELIHVGSAFCSTHRTNLKNPVAAQEKKAPPKRTKTEDTYDEDFALAHDDVLADDVSSDSEDDNDDFCADPEPSVKDKISEHFSSIATLMGSRHYHTKKSKQPHSPDTKRRKVSLVVSMVQLLCSFVAPTFATEMVELVSEKLSPKKKIESDACADQISTAIGERLLDAPNRRARIETLALIVDLPYFSATKVLTSIPTVTKYLIHKARLFNCGGINFDEKYTKVRYNELAVDFFISFVVRSNAVISLPWLNNFAKKSDGSKVEMGASVRLQAYIKIDRMYREELRKYEKDKSFTLSYGTIYKILSSIVPRLNQRMTCVDDFLVDALEGWARLQAYVKDLGNLGHLTAMEESDLDRRVKLAKSFLEGSYRAHIELSSNVAEHCATFALSDPKKPAYREKCTHEHDAHCQECMEVEGVLDILKEKMISAKNESDENEATDRFQLERMCGMTAKCIKYIKTYKAHLVRAVVSDSEKARVQAALEDNEVLITADWAQKLLPESAIEPQSGYFGKGGMSLHISHIYAKLNGKYYHHGINHVFQSCKQMSSDVASILRHVFAVLKTKGIKKIFLRSDNAACYKSADLLGDLYHLANESPQLSRYIYSEAQAGKGPCDRGASHVKRKVKECTQSRKNARDAKEIFDALTKNEAVKGTSTYLCVAGAGKEKGIKSQVPDISTLFDITFEKDGILARKHSGIGTGLKTPKTKLKQMKTAFSILESGGHLDDTFWVELKAGSVGDVDEGEKESDITNALKPRKDFVCSTPGCLASFLRLRNLEIHEIVGNHKFKSKKQSLVDYSIDTFNHKIEVIDVAQKARANDSFANRFLEEDFLGLPMGWALKVNSNDTITDKAYEEAVSYFMSQRSLIPLRRAEPRAFSIMMENMMEPDGLEYKFRAFELLTEKQLTGLFSRLETKRVSGVSVARKPRGRQASKSSRKRSHPASSGEEEEAPPQAESDDDLNEDDDMMRMDEEDLIRECIKERHNEIFL